jgi:hypothetical protein
LNISAIAAISDSGFKGLEAGRGLAVEQVSIHELNNKKLNISVERRRYCYNAAMLYC